MASLTAPSGGAAKPQHLPALTGVRGFAAIWVVCYHFSISVAGQFGWQATPGIFFFGKDSWASMYALF